jgi:hypothetical protein
MFVAHTAWQDVEWVTGHRLFGIEYLQCAAERAKKSSSSGSSARSVTARRLSVAQHLEAATTNTQIHLDP